MPIENITRFKIFDAFVKSQDMLRVSDVAHRVNMPKQKIVYHLPVLKSQGLILQDEHLWFCQPVFLDAKLQTIIQSAITDILNYISESNINIVTIPDVEVEDVIFNCLCALFYRELYAKHLRPNI